MLIPSSPKPGATNAWYNRETCFTYQRGVGILSGQRQCHVQLAFGSNKTETIKEKQYYPPQAAEITRSVCSSFNIC